jgi:hypothetical protein
VGLRVFPRKKIGVTPLPGDTPQMKFRIQKKNPRVDGYEQQVEPAVLVVVSQRPRQVRNVRDLNTCVQTTFSQCAAS